MKDYAGNAGNMLSPVKLYPEKPDQRIFFNPGNAKQSGAQAVKTPGGGFVLTRFLLPFHRMEKEGPVRPKDRNDKKRGCLCLKRIRIAKIRNAAATRQAIAVTYRIVTVSSMVIFLHIGLSDKSKKFYSHYLMPCPESYLI